MKLFASVLAAVTTIAIIPACSASAGPGAQLCCQVHDHSCASVSSSPSASQSATSHKASSGVYIPFCGRQRRANPAQIAYVGNTGVNGHYGCNIMPIPATIASMYNYTINFMNKGASKQECKCWNKIEPAGGVNGFQQGNEAFTFTMAPGGQQFVAVDNNSQIGCTCHANSIPLTPKYQFASTWVEADFGNESNTHTSGFDASCLVAAEFGLAIPGLSVCGRGTCSTIHPGDTGENAYVSGMDGVDGVGGNLSSGPLALTVMVDTR